MKTLKEQTDKMIDLINNQKENVILLVNFNNDKPKYAEKLIQNCMQGIEINKQLIELSNNVQFNTSKIIANEARITIKELQEQIKYFSKFIW